MLYYPSKSEMKDLHPTLATNCVFNSFLCYTAIMLNIATIRALRKTLSLPDTLKTLLLSLVVSDAGVGLLAQPFYISILVRWIQQQDTSCSIHKAFNIITHFFSVTSYLGVVAVTVDRFLAIHLHLRYQELVTHKRVVAVVISIWMISAFISLTMMWAALKIRLLFFSVSTLTGLFITILVYFSIYLTIRRHKNHIQAVQFQQVSQNGEISSLANLFNSSAVSVFYIYLVFLICYLPLLISSAACAIFNPGITLKRFFLFSLTFVYLNSSLNPVIYCWKMRHIRHAIMDILRNMFRTSH